MTQGTNLQTMLGATLAISATLPLTYDAAGYASTLVAYTAVGQVEDYGEHGGQANVSKFTPVDTGTITKSKGSKDYGKLDLMIGSVRSDAGQKIIDAAFESTNHYSVKMTYPTRQGESTPEIHYFDVVVTQRQFKDGKVDDFMKVAATFEICRKPVIVDAT